MTHRVTFKFGEEPRPVTAFRARVNALKVFATDTLRSRYFDQETLNMAIQRVKFIQEAMFEMKALLDQEKLKPDTFSSIKELIIKFKDDHGRELALKYLRQYGKAVELNAVKPIDYPVLRAAIESYRAGIEAAKPMPKTAPWNHGACDGDDADDDADADELRGEDGMNP